MNLRIKTLIVGFVCSFWLVACSNTPPANNQSSTSNSNTQNAGPTPSVAVSHGTDESKPNGGQSTGGGSPIDTSKYDADIKKAEERYNKNQKENAAKMALAQAYVERANALVDPKARQYRAALGDYRRALKYDPNNEEAKVWIDRIVSILQQMGREVPEEGKEPQPLPMNK